MTFLREPALGFADRALAGYCAASPAIVRPTHGGVLAREATDQVRPVVVVGGGSGHFPAFAGFVGQGMADGAVVGDIFASPSTARIVAVATASSRGGGVLLAYGNYAGDCLNFGLAAEQLRAEGIDCLELQVTDDVASAPVSNRHERRGIAGGLIVYKIAAAAALRESSLSAVHEVASRANERTRSFGVAFTACRLPGAEGDLFEVPATRMAVGLGIHGEPGISTEPLPTAASLAELLVDRTLNELGTVHRAAVVLNGLGTMKWDELFVLWNEVSRALHERGVVMVSPVVDEVATSLDMGGCSLSVCALDDDLEELWSEPCRSTALTRLRADRSSDAGLVEDSTDDSVVGGEATIARQGEAGLAVAVLEQVAEELVRAEHALGELDSIGGDGDHGLGMARGAKAAIAAAKAAPESASAGDTIIAAGQAWADLAGGTSGALWGNGLAAFGRAVNAGAGLAPGARVVGAVEAFRAAIAQVGGAQEGDKTMVDALAPFARTLASAVPEAGLAEGLLDACQSARHGADRTADMHATRGRARTHGEATRGHIDPGAESFVLVVTAAAAEARRYAQEHRELGED